MHIRTVDPSLAGVGTHRRMLPFLVWLAAFYTLWFVINQFGRYWQTTSDHWPIAAAMAIGSYFAGSTPMGGGTIGFPVLVLLFNEPATLGRTFSFAVQSIGMVSASIFILCRRQPLEWRMLRWAMGGALIGTPLGIAFVAPLAPDLLIKLLFSVMWCSFGLMHFVKLNAITGAEGMTRLDAKLERILGAVIGIVGGTLVASITGVGIDMLIYTVLVLVARADLKIAIPTSILLMAWTSLVGISSCWLLGEMQPELHAIPPEVFYNWLAAAPIVALGAPFGVLIVAKIGRKPTLFIVSVLCLLQFVWTLVSERAAMTLVWYGIAALGILGFNVVFHILYVWGGRLVRDRDHIPLPSPESDGA